MEELSWVESICLADCGWHQYVWYILWVESICAMENWVETV